MRRIFASVLAVIMLVSCFAVSTSAITDNSMELSFEQVTEDGKEYLNVTLTITTTPSQTTGNVNPTIACYWYVAPQGAIANPVVTLGGTTTDESTLAFYQEGGDDYLEVGFLEGGAMTAGTPYVHTITVKFELLADAGTVITFTDDGTEFADGCGNYDMPENVNGEYTVAANEPPVVIGEAASVGAQIRAEKYDDVSDIRFAFTADETAEIASVEYKITCNGKEITVDGKTASHDGLFKVVVENVPADYYDADFAVDFVVTYADGTVKTASDINNINAVAA